MIEAENESMMLVTDRGVLVQPPLKPAEVVELIVAKALVPEYEAEQGGTYEEPHTLVLFDHTGQDRRQEAAFCIKLAELRGINPPREHQQTKKKLLRIAS